MARSHAPPRCTDCRAPILWLRLRGSWRPFNPKPVDGHDAHAAYPVLERHAWPVQSLIDELTVTRECSRAEIEEEVRDMPWHGLHVCLPSDLEARRTEQQRTRS